MDAIAALPEDVQLMIFSRVGNVKDLFKFAVTCWWWVHRFTDSEFLCQLFKGNHASLTGFFFQKTRFEFCKMTMEQRTTESASVSATTFMLSPWSPLTGPTERPLTAFIPDHDGTFNYAKPLEARHGIILMQLVPRSFDHQKPPVLLSLCNPITGETHLLLPLETPHCPLHVTSYYPRTDLRVTMNAIITTTDNSNLEGVQLLITTSGSEPDSEVYLHSYSVVTRTWSTPTRWREGNCYSLVRERAAVVHRGVAHWLFTDRRTMHSVHEDHENLYKLSVEVGTMKISMTKLPFRAGGSRLLYINKDGKLSVICIYVIHVTLWTQQECGEGDDNHALWLRTVIMITPDPNYVPQIHSGTWPRHWFGLNNGSLLVLNYGGYTNSSSYSICILDLEKKVMEEVMHSFLHETDKETGLAFVPYEMDLVKFFVFRLGGICED